MRSFIRSRATKSGLPPGALVHVGERKVDETRIKMLAYDAQHVEETGLRLLDQCVPPIDRSGVTWINVDGLHEAEALGRLGQRFGLHPLVIEDILNTDQRPKQEDYGEYVYVVLKSLYHLRASGEPEIEQVSLILGPNYVLSFQERGGDEFDPIRERIHSSASRVRKMGPDYLVHALLDLIVDRYFGVLEGLGDRMESLEEELVENSTTQTLETIHHLKREMAFLRRSIWPLREVISALERSDSPLIQQATCIYLRDAYDHAIEVMDALEIFRDMLSGMLDIYLSSVSNRMNEVMKVLTVIATLFIPLTFVAGVYGMNFKYMPELEWRWAYPLVWLVMISVAGLMVAYFRRKKWL